MAHVRACLVAIAVLLQRVSLLMPVALACRTTGFSLKHQHAAPFSAPTLACCQQERCSWEALRHTHSTLLHDPRRRRAVRALPPPAASALQAREALLTATRQAFSQNIDLHRDASPTNASAHLKAGCGADRCAGGSA
jgi:hypothetical protein